MAENQQPTQLIDLPLDVLAYRLNESFVESSKSAGKSIPTESQNIHR